VNYHITILFDYDSSVTELGAGFLFSNGEIACSTILGSRIEVFIESVDALFRKLRDTIEQGFIFIELAPIDLPVP
jgi:hypothetical protein